MRGKDMAISHHSAALAFSLAAVLCWGTGDFVGGYGVRRANAFSLTTLAHLAGSLLMIALALLHHSAFPSRGSAGWAVAAGLSGGAALAIFYRALSSGKMGLTSPVAAVIAAAIPTAVGIIREGMPGKIQIAGFLVAGLSIWLISRPEDGARPEGIGLAVLAGLGFAGFFLCIKQAGDGSALWVVAIARVASLVLTAVIVLWSSRDFRLTRPAAVLGVLAGFLDISGSALFLRAAQTGRLDAAVVISSLYPAITVLLARLVLKERFSRWQALGMLTALAAVPMIAG
jgi:drug/metabolite transporter (DMT)-like permease